MRRILLTYFTLACLSAAGQSRYQINFQDQRADLAVKELEARFNLKFSYDPSYLEEYRVTSNISARTEDQLLRAFVSQLPLRFKIASDVILLIPSKKKQPRKTTSRKVRGKVYDRKTGQPLALANVQSQELRTKSDQSGGFSVRPQRDSIQITVSYLGYEPSSMWVKTDLDQVSIQLTPTNELKPFILNPESKGSTQKSLVSHFSINPKQISSLPALGQPDVFKSLQLLPGLNATDESTTGLIVRGSGPEQNLVMLDGYTIYHMDHFFGLFSTFNPNIINHVDLYKGAFSAEYGRRTSAVVDATTRNSNLEKVTGGVGLNATSFDGFIEVPIGKKLGIVLGARSSHNGLLSNDIYNQFLENHRRDIVQAQEPDINSDLRTEVEPNFNFFDTNAKIRFTPNRNTTIDLSLFISEDSYRGAFEEEEDLVGREYLDKAFWANNGASLRWESHWNDKHTSTFTLSGSSYESTSSIFQQWTFFSDIIFGFGSEIDTIFREGEREVFGVDKQNTIEDITLAYKSEVNISPFSRLTVGTEISNFETQLSIGITEDEEAITDSVGLESGLFTVFGNYQYAREKWQLNAGLRVNNYEILSRSDLEPRLGLRYFITDELSIGGSWSRHSQFLHRVTLSPFGNSDQYYWTLAEGEDYPVLESAHLIAGIKWQKGPLTFDIEAYRKRTEGITESEFTLFSEFNGIDQDEISDFNPVGDNVARGIDIFARYKSPQLSTWIGYTIASSINRFDNSHLPESYYSALDQRHEINQVNLYRLGNWEFGSTFIFGSGRPYTPPGEDGFTDDEDPVLYDLSRLNSQRLPVYHRLDLSVKYQHDFNWVKIEAGMTMFNVYDHTNIKSRRFTARFESDDENSGDEAQQGSFQTIPLDIELLGRTPNFFLNLRF
ncbi:MAG: TonB-dependent receptor plug domain-containing protein [Bacteroidota bacterium]